jgi:hypothetical protein
MPDALLMRQEAKALYSALAFLLEAINGVDREGDVSAMEELDAAMLDAETLVECFEETYSDA